MGVRKTRDHAGVTIAHGPFQAHETERVCLAGCRRRGVPFTRRPAAVVQLLLPRSSVGYDVMVGVGMWRFLEGRPREQMRLELAARGIDLST
ncbi:MAG: transposase, partial [Candidatus Binatia bacterium]